MNLCREINIDVGDFVIVEPDGDILALIQMYLAIRMMEVRAVRAVPQRVTVGGWIKLYPNQPATAYGHLHALTLSRFRGTDYGVVELSPPSGSSTLVFGAVMIKVCTLGAICFKVSTHR